MHSVIVGQGPPVVMVHCMLGRHESLLPLAAAIGGRATLFDLPGHGRSPDWDRAQAYQAQTVALAASSCHGPTHLIGHSFGATVALRLAVERPDLVARLTLIEPVYFAAAKGTPAHAEHALRFRPFVLAMLAGDEDRAAEIFNALWGQAAWAAIPTRLKAYMTDRIHLIVASAKEIEEDPVGVTSAARLGVLDMPVTLIRGAQSQPVIAAIHATLADRIAGAVDHVIADAGHMLPLTHTAQVAEIIRGAVPETG